jgi:hypothetical protein
MSSRSNGSTVSPEYVAEAARRKWHNDLKSFSSQPLGQDGFADCRRRNRARGQMQELPSVRKFHDRPLALCEEIAILLSGYLAPDRSETRQWSLVAPGGPKHLGRYVRSWWGLT